MKFFRLLLPVCAFAFSAVASAAPKPLLVLAQDFQFPGGWMVETRSGSLGTRILRTPGTDLNALTAVHLSSAGEYTVWARTLDFPEADPGARRFTVAVNGVRLASEAGDHGGSGWAWESLGAVKLPAGETVLEIVDTTRFYGRADAILLSADPAFDPNAQNRSALLRLKAPTTALTAEPAAQRPASYQPAPALDPAAPARELATLAAANARVRFLAVAGFVRRVTEVRAADGSWIPVPDEPRPESLLVLHSAENTLEAGQIHPRWRNPANELLIRSGGRDYRTAADSANPYRAADSVTYLARSATTLPDGSVRLTFAPSSSAGSAPLTATWRVAPGGDDFSVSVSVSSLQRGFFSVACAPFRAWAPSEVAFNLLPPLYQFQRAPVRPMLVPSSVTPQPLSLIELPATDARPALTLGVAADPGELPFEWPDAANARYGFALQADDSRLSPAVFQPLLGFDGSAVKAGETRVLRWRVLARASDWRDTLAYASEKIFGVTDYRHPVNASLTTAALNMIELLQDEKGGGFDPSLRGFWNIEGRGVATQAAPLVLLSAALLTDDENLYASHGLPAIEWTLSRAIAHFARAVPDTHPPYVDQKTIQITSPSRFYGAAYWQGVDSLTGSANPWVTDLVDKAAAAGPRQKWVPKFSDTLALHRLKPSPELLALAEQQAADYVAKEIDGQKTGDLGYTPFYNHDFIPVWWDLLALHELTGNPRWLAAAETGGMLTIAGLRSQPRPTAPAQLIHPNNEFVGNDHLWWRGDVHFRLGLPRVPGDVTEKTVPSWQVSPVGLGFEQPSTFFAGARAHVTSGFQNILMSSWTPALLRLHAITGKAAYRDYARSGVVGRFANYPGYYLRGFTDLVHDPRYPLQGPDVTSFYYHHIPVHLAFTLDWLFAEAELRSGGAIKFPYAQQAGYVWFNNRVYGANGGELFGDKNARPLLPKGVTVSDPGLNWLAARSDKKFWLVLMNDAPEPRPASVALSSDLVLPGPVQVHAPGQAARPIAQDRLATVSIPPRGLVALAFPAEAAPAKPALPPVTAAPLAADLPEGQGKVLAWRIRSPFGKDSLYVVLDGGPDRTGAYELILDGHEPRTVTRYPYEFTVHPISPDATLAFRIRHTDTSGAITTSESFDM